MGEPCCQPPASACPCPVCGQSAKSVPALTLEQHVPTQLRAKLGNVASFCANPSCEVVYCAPSGATVRVGETVLPVTVKDSGDEVHVCYCFDFKRADIRRELEASGKTEIPDRIRNGIKDGLCDCERKNPQGSCCLGNVAAAIKAISAELSSKSE